MSKTTHAFKDEHPEGGISALCGRSIDRLRVSLSINDVTCAQCVRAFYQSKAAQPSADPVPVLLICPSCYRRHIDEGDWATKPHHTHACQHCGNVWRPAIVATVGVQFLPGFKNEVPPLAMTP